MATSIRQRLTEGDASRAQRPIDKLLACAVALFVGLFLYGVVFSSLAGTYTTIGQKAAIAVIRQSLTSIIESNGDSAVISEYVKKTRALYPEIASVWVYSGNTAVSTGQGAAKGAPLVLADLDSFHKNGNIELFSLSDSSLSGYRIPLTSSGGYWTMAVLFQSSGGLLRAVPFLIGAFFVAFVILVVMLQRVLTRDMARVQRIAKYFALSGMAVYFLLAHFLLVGLDSDWTSRGNTQARSSLQFLLDRGIIEGKDAIESSQLALPAARKAYRDAVTKYQDQLDDAVVALQTAKDDLDVATRDNKQQRIENANNRINAATAKKSEAEMYITQARDQFKMLKATIENTLKPVLQGRTGGLFKAGFNRMMDGNDVPRFGVDYDSKGAFQIVQHDEVDGMRPWLTLVILLGASFFIIQLAIGFGIIMEKRFAGVKTFFYYFFLEIFVLACMLPVIWIIVASFFSETGIKSIISTIKESEIFIRNFISLDNYKRNLEGLFLVYFRNSLVVSGVTALFCGSLGILAGYAFSRFRFPGRQKQMMWILVSQLFPMAMMIVPLYIVSQVLGINKGLFVIIIAYSATSLPFSIWMMKGYFDTVPISLEEAASIDGASTLRRMWHVLLPLSRPAIATTIFYSFITSWNEFAISSFFLNEKELRTLPVALNAMLDSFNPQYALFSAAGVLASLPVVLLFVYLQKHLVSGLMAGGVKG